MPLVLRQRKPVVKNPTVAETVEPRPRVTKRRPTGDPVKMLEPPHIPRHCKYCKTRFFADYVCTV